MSGQRQFRPGPRRIAPRWWLAIALTATYSYLRIFVHGSTYSDDDENRTPEHLFGIRSDYDINEDRELSTALYFAGHRPVQSAPGRPEKSSSAYYRLDVGLSWQVSDHLEMSVRGQNLLDGSHTEFVHTGFDTGVGQVERGAYVQATCRRRIAFNGAVEYLT